MFKLGKLSILSLCFSIIFFNSSPAQSIEKNSHVTYTVQEVNGLYKINYRFMDHFLNYQTYNLSMPVIESKQMIAKFGIPNWLFEPYVDNTANRQVREQEMEKGLFLLNEQTIEVDKNAVLAYYSETFAKPIAQMIVSSLADYGADTRRNRIEFTIRFIQDIPYGVPEYKDELRHYGGVHVPPQLLIKGYGDCDSKVLLFVGILSYLVPMEDIIFLNQKEHVLSAVREDPSTGLTYVRFKNSEYLIAETAGPGKRLLGEKGSYYQERFNIETLKIEAPQIIPYTENQEIFGRQMDFSHMAKNILMIRNDSEKAFQFQISPDNRHWESLNLGSNEAGKYEFDRKVDLFIRFQDHRNRHVTYEISTGNLYSVAWNNHRKKWEILANPI